MNVRRISRLKGYFAELRSTPLGSILAQRRLLTFVYWIAACALIYIGIWTTAPRDVPANAYDEPIWLYHSLCGDAVFTSRFQDSCREINLQSLDQSAGAKYVYAIARQLAGIPAEVVQYYYHNDASAVSLDSTIRTPFIVMMTALSSISLLLLFFILQRSFGYGAALISLALIVLTPFWQFVLRAIMAEPSLIFFSILSLASTLWLTRLLGAPQRKSLPSILGATLCVGLSIGCAIGVKANATVVALAFVLIMLYVGIVTRNQWFLIFWILTIVALVIVVCFIATNPFLWSRDFLSRARMFAVFRSVLISVFVSGKPPAPADSLRFTFAASFQAPQFTLIPLALSLPLCIIGVWRSLSRHELITRAVCIWFLATGVGNALTVYIDPSNLVAWGRYVLYTVLAIHVFIGYGIWSVAHSAVKGRWFPLSQAQNAAPPFPLIPPKQRYSAISKCLAGVCVACLFGVLVSGAFLSHAVGAERSLWQRYILANTVNTQIESLNQILTHDRQARTWYIHGADGRITGAAGEPVADVLTGYFELYQQSTDPAVLHALVTTGSLLQTAAIDPDLRARIHYETAHLGDNLTLQTRQSIVVGPLDNTLPLATLQQLLPKDWSEDPHALLQNPYHAIQVTAQVPRDGSYRLIAEGANWAPAPVRIGVTIDKTPVGMLIYDRGDGSWTPDTVVAFLSKGPHTIQFQLLNDYADPGRGIDRNGAIRKVTFLPTSDSRLCRDTQNSSSTPLSAGLCSTGEPPVMLDGTASTAIPADVPFPALYDVNLTIRKSNARPQRLAVMVDGMPLASARTFDGAEGNLYSTTRLLPIHLSAGSHMITVTRLADQSTSSAPSSFIVDELALIPHYPDTNILTPERFGSSDLNVIPIPQASTITASWKGYGYNYSFYNVQVLGSTTDGKATMLDVTVDGQMIGTTSLARDGTVSPPLAVELANGATHSITLHPTDLADNAKALIYAVQIRPYVGSQIYAGTNMRWAKQDNRKVQSDQSIVHLSSNVRLTRSTSIGAAGVYTITMRVRRTGAGDQPATLAFDVDGWHVGEDSVQANGDWAALTYTTYLPTGPHDLQFTWQGGTRTDHLDIMYLTIQQHGIDPPS